MKFRTKPINQLFHIKDFAPDGESRWKTETLVGSDPVVHGVTLLESDSIFVHLTEDRVKSATTMAKITVGLSRVGVDFAGLNKVGRIVRKVNLALFAGEATCELDVWTDAPVEPL